MRDNEEAKVGIWASLLEDVHANAENRLKSYGTCGASAGPQLVILGGEQVGKTRLITSLRESGEAPSGVGLEFHCLTLTDESREEPLQLCIWCLDGDPEHSNLLKFAVTKANIWHTMLVICLDLSDPWSLLNDLQLWLSITEKHVARLKLDPGELQMLQISVEDYFSNYIDPGASDDQSPAMGQENVASVTGSHSLNRVASVSIPLIGGAVSPASEWPYSPLHPILQKDDNNQAEDNVIPGNPFGIPVLVVVTKADAGVTLERENGFTDEHFDVIQYHLRKICLQYRAGLVYVSAKEEINTELLRRYLKHRLYATPFHTSALMTEPTALFIPCGWDNAHRIELLTRNLPEKCLKEKFVSCLPRPKNIRGKAFSKGKKLGPGGTPVVEEPVPLQTVEDEQTFLARIQVQLANLNTQSVGATPPTDGSQVKTSEQMAVPGSTQAVGSGSHQANISDKEAVLSSFFNSLLTRKNLTETSPTPASPGHSPQKSLLGQKPNKPVGMSPRSPSPRGRSPRVTQAESQKSTPGMPSTESRQKMDTPYSVGQVTTEKTTDSVKSETKLDNDVKQESRTEHEPNTMMAEIDPVREETDDLPDEAKVSASEEAASPVEQMCSQSSNVDLKEEPREDVEKGTNLTGTKEGTVNKATTEEEKPAIMTEEENSLDRMPGDEAMTLIDNADMESPPSGDNLKESTGEEFEDQTESVETVERLSPNQIEQPEKQITHTNVDDRTEETPFDDVDLGVPGGEDASVYPLGEEENIVISEGKQAIEEPSITAQTESDQIVDTVQGENNETGEEQPKTIQPPEE
ncbi:hypothetical protein CRM22_010811 [Opisthorchis felineus]|uniref:Dynein light intermediate chain n=1 Tax=Opisthorchis felineus TaxID=147828 RepID=A0A4S2KM99_OPIFE|nr:hypothetical protein CRM22_010811 [Opisthorchis felineus]